MNKSRREEMRLGGFGGGDCRPVPFWGWYAKPVCSSIRATAQSPVTDRQITRLPEVETARMTAELCYHVAEAHNGDRRVHLVDTVHTEVPSPDSGLNKDLAGIDFPHLDVKRMFRSDEATLSRSIRRFRECVLYFSSVCRPCKQDRKDSRRVSQWTTTLKGILNFRDNQFSREDQIIVSAEHQ